MLVVVLGMLGCLAGCEPEELVIWNWNLAGDKALVLTSDATVLVDDKGNIQQLSPVPAWTAAWLPDGKRVVLAQRRQFDTWDKLSVILDKERANKIAVQARLLRAAVMAAQDLEDAGPALEALPSELREAVVLFMRDHADDALRAKLGDQWDELAKATASVGILTVTSVEKDEDNPEIRLAVILPGVVSIRVSPDGRHAAIATPYERQGQNLLKLSVVALNRADQVPVDVALGVARQAQWTPDGRELVYLAGSAMAQADMAQLGTLIRRRVVDDEGRLAVAEEQQNLAGLLFSQSLRVRCLADGRILFATAPMTLPLAEKPQPRTTIYEYEPRTRSLRQLISDEAAAQYPNRVDLFEVSPDGKHMVVAGSNGSVAVVELATGKHRQIVEAGEDSSLVSVPSWRTSESLSVVIPVGGRIAGKKAQPATRPAVALVNVSDGTAKVISESWPQAVIDGITKRANPQAQTQPATQPTTGPATQPAQH